MKQRPMKSSKKGQINWNDHISQFIKIKIERPEVIRQLLQKQAEYSQQKEYEKRIFQEKKKQQSAFLHLDKEVKSFQEMSALKDDMLQELLQIKIENDRILKELQAAQLFSLLKRNSTHPTSNQLQTSGSIQNPIFSEQQLTIKQQEYNKIKHYLSKDISKLVEQKINLKQQINSMKQNIKALNIEWSKSNQNYQINTIRQMHRQLEEKSTNLTEKLGARQRQAQNFRQGKNRQKQAIQASKMRIANFTKEAKDWIYSDKHKNSKKVSKFMERFKISDLDDVFSKLSKLQENKQEEYSRSLKFQASLNQFSQKIGKLDDFKKQIIKNYQKNIDYQEKEGFQNNIDQAVYSYEQYLENLKKTEKGLKEQIEMLSKNLQKKQKQLQFAKKNK